MVVLDPCCGTGAYLRAALRRIAATLHNKGGDALVANDLKKATMERVFGFEILPAPFVIAHLQLGLELETLGAPLSDRSDPPERAGVYLTNALTGWEPPKEKPKQIAFPGFDDERDAAGEVKQNKPILVILGNPPYNAFAGVSPEEENGLVEPYKKGLISEWGIKKFNLDDLYIRFFRLAEKRIAEHGGRGVVSFISNHSWVSDPSFVVLRRHLLNSFDRFWIENMHGNRKISEYAQDGRTSETVFAIPGFSVGIQQGVAISLWVKHPKRKGEPFVRFRDDLNDAKAVERRAHLLSSLDDKDFDAQYETSNPRKDNRWTFRPSDVTSTYLGWPTIPEVAKLGTFNGPYDARKEALYAIDREHLALRMAKYYNAQVSDSEVAALHLGLMDPKSGFDPERVRSELLRTSAFHQENIFRMQFKPFDRRYYYCELRSALCCRPSPELMPHVWSGNAFIVTRNTGVADPEGAPIFFSSGLVERDQMRGHARLFPLRIKAGADHRAGGRKSANQALPGMEQDADRITANLSAAARDYLASLGLPGPDNDQATAERIWYHALAIGYSPAYLAENADGIRQDWPRIPLPKAKDLLLASAALGRQVAALLDTEVPVPGVTSGKVQDELRSIAVFQRVDGKPAKPEAGDLDLTAGWGHAGKGGITMPGKGKLIRRDDGAYDIYLNDVACWRNVPVAVWDYTIGGYQVLKKWLSYREKPLLGRSLTPDEVRYVTEMARRLTALIGLQASLDANYREVIHTTYPWTNQ